jgi:opacity protein-like surface antigen
MKKLFIAAALFATCTAFAQSNHYVNSYTRKDGTYVQGHYQTDPNSTKLDNYSTQGNVNPYTGQAGTVNPYNQPSSQGYQQPQQQVCGHNMYGQYVCR